MSFTGGMITDEGENIKCNANVKKRVTSVGSKGMSKQNLVLQD